MKPVPFSPFAMAQEHFDRAGDRLELDEPTRDLLREPMRELQFAIPVRMDDGRARIFRAWPTSPASRAPTARVARR